MPVIEPGLTPSSEHADAAPGSPVSNLGVSLPPDQFQMDVIICTSCVEVRVRGELDCATAPVFEKQLCSVVAEQQPPQVMLDLLELTFMDSSGLNALLRANRLLEPPGQMILYRPQAAVRRALDVSGVSAVLHVVGGEAVSN